MALSHSPHEQPILSFPVPFFFKLFFAALGRLCCPWAFSNCGERGTLFVAVLELLITVAFPVAEHGLLIRGLEELLPVGSVVAAPGL